jgi:hypothetical protein
VNCFVIMPFHQDFDDVYAAIKAGVESAVAKDGCHCFRLDEMRPAGRISSRLLKELRTATICVADLTGSRANVMWEVGFAMALSCPTILVTQALSELPFDIRDMQSLQYDRGRLSQTLTAPLKQVVVDTLSVLPQRVVAEDNSELVGQLLAQVNELKSIVSAAVRSWQSPAIGTDARVQTADVRVLEGAWVSSESRSHMYAKVIRGELVAPYCFRGNGELTGAYYSWKKAGGYWFAKYCWLTNASSPPAGFTFLQQESLDVLRGAWWGNESGDYALPPPPTPPSTSGNNATWRRRHDADVPKWARSFFDEVERRGLPGRLTDQ